MQAKTKTTGSTLKYRIFPAHSFFMISLISMTLSSCGEKWLNVESHDKILIDEYYNSEARIKEALDLGVEIALVVGSRPPRSLS